jgi:hypothetical protein
MSRINGMRITMVQHAQQARQPSPSVRVHEEKVRRLPSVPIKDSWANARDGLLTVGCTKARTTYQWQLIPNQRKWVLIPSSPKTRKIPLDLTSLIDDLCPKMVGKCENVEIIYSTGAAVSQVESRDAENEYVQWKKGATINGIQFFVLTVRFDWEQMSNDLFGPTE